MKMANTKNQMPDSEKILFIKSPVYYVVFTKDKAPESNSLNLVNR